MQDSASVGRVGKLGVCIENKVMLLLLLQGAQAEREDSCPLQAPHSQEMTRPPTLRRGLELLDLDSLNILLFLIFFFTLLPTSNSSVACLVHVFFFPSLRKKVHPI